MCLSEDRQVRGLVAVLVLAAAAAALSSPLGTHGQVSTPEKRRGQFVAVNPSDRGRPVFTSSPSARDSDHEVQTFTTAPLVNVPDHRHVPGGLLTRDFRGNRRFFGTNPMATVTLRRQRPTRKSRRSPTPAFTMAKPASEVSSGQLGKRDPAVWSGRNRATNEDSKWPTISGNLASPHGQADSEDPGEKRPCSLNFTEPEGTIEVRQPVGSASGEECDYLVTVYLGYGIELQERDGQGGGAHTHTHTGRVSLMG
ncbi:hypothetical protein NHX12_010685 [Muraenolepis orangiensis]|uniref:Uncharacterized protein n=1 Tax=Muraenolepis orangiensis TaxID=630683 RepID=A0A9Q0DK37_9TELE|nr:hypothetical protein NHX12_010685 [Muraenolepis orangiensis]